MSLSAAAVLRPEIKETIQIKDMTFYCTAVHTTLGTTQPVRVSYSRKTESLRSLPLNILGVKTHVLLYVLNARVPTH